MPKQPPENPRPAPAPPKPRKGKGHGLLTAAHNKEGQVDASTGDQECEAEQPNHGLLTAAHNKEKRP